MDYARARVNMVDGQLTPNKITSKSLLKYMSELPREIFVDGPSKNTAYADSIASVGYGRFMFTPLVCARLIQELNIQREEKVLIIAAATGYSAALASKLGAEVYTVEENRNLCDVSRRMLSDQSCQVQIKHGDLLQGDIENAPFDKILIDTPIQEVSEELLAQLNENGLIAAVVDKEGVMVATVYRKVKNTLFEEHLLETTGQVMDSLKQKEKFVF